MLQCLRYIDLNPVRARMADDPLACTWSSCATHCGQREDALLTPHPAYTALAATTPDRTKAYHRLVHEDLAEDDLAAIHAYLQQQRALGRDDFRAMVEAKTQRFAGVQAAHRPARNTTESRK